MFLHNAEDVIGINRNVGNLVGLGPKGVMPDTGGRRPATGKHAHPGWETGRIRGIGPVKPGAARGKRIEERHSVQRKSFPCTLISPVLIGHNKDNIWLVAHGVMIQEPIANVDLMTWAFGSLVIWPGNLHNSWILKR